MAGLRKVLVRVEANTVYIQKLGETESGQVALDPNQAWWELGTVLRGIRVVDGMNRKLWIATDRYGAEFTGATKQAAVAALLASFHMEAVPDEATIPALFD